MQLDFFKQQQYTRWLNELWDEYQENPHFGQNMEIFLVIAKSFASSTAEAYIDAWYKDHQTTTRAMP